jgi:hypothetical protein
VISSPVTPCTPPWPVKPGVVIGFLHERFIHVPIELLATHTKRLDPASGWWRSVLAATGQPERFN